MTGQDKGSSDWPPKIVGCVGTIVLDGQKALFVRQAKGSSLEGRWSIPWGVIDPYEFPDEAAIRETREESGVLAEIEGLLGIQNLPSQGWIGIIFLARHVGGEPIPDGGIETDAAAYFSLEEMDTFTEPFEPWCEWIVRRVMRGDYHLLAPERLNPYQPRVSFF